MGTMEKTTPTHIFSFDICVNEKLCGASQIYSQIVGQSDTQNSCFMGCHNRHPEVINNNLCLQGEIARKNFAHIIDKHCLMLTTYKDI